MRDFMQIVVAHVHADETDDAYNLLRYLNEPNETHLGLTADGMPARGRAVGEVFAELIISAIQGSAAGQSGLIVDLEDTVMMIEGIGSDLISDITTNIIRGPLIAYTNEMCDTYGVDMSAFQPRREQAVWDPATHEWDFPEVTLPIANGRPLILVPKWIVRRKVDADLYFHDYLQRFIVEREMENPNSQFVYVLKNKQRRANIAKIQETFGKKAAATRLLASDPNLYRQYRDAVNAGDPRKPNTDPVMTAVNARPPNLDTLLREVLVIPTGIEAATTYERAVDRLFSAMFSSVLLFPKPQQPQNTGQKRLDMLWTNAAQSGFFWWVKDQCNASYVIGEYKNYGAEIGNPEFDQLAGRFGPSKGQLGVLICRKIKDRHAAIHRAREIRADKHGFIIAMDDDDLRGLVEAAKSGPDEVFGFLIERFTQIAQ
jgi:hypothetical protein